MQTGKDLCDNKKHTHHKSKRNNAAGKRLAHVTEERFEA